MISFAPISGAPIAARDLDFVASGAQPDDPFILTEGFDDGLEDLGLELSQYWQIDDDVVAAVDPSLVYLLDITVDDIDEPVSFYQNAEDEETLPAGFDLDISIDGDSLSLQDSPDVSFYAQADDDPVIVDATLAYLLDASPDDDIAAPAGDYFVIEDDPVAGQPEALFGSFDFIDEEAQFDDAASFYYQQGDDVIVVTPPVSGSELGGGGGGGGRRVSFEQADRIRKQLREIETRRRKKWAKPKEFERQIEQIYRDLYETPYRDELPELAKETAVSLTHQPQQVKKPDFSLLLKDLTAIRQLIDLYQTYLDDEEAVALLLLL